MIVNRTVTCEECKGEGEYRKPKWKFWRSKIRCRNCQGRGIVKIPVEIADFQSVKAQYYPSYSQNLRYKSVERKQEEQKLQKQEDDDLVVQTAALVLNSMEELRISDPEPEHEGKFGGAGATGSWEEKADDPVSEISSHEESSSFDSSSNDFSSSSSSSDSGSDNNNSGNGGC